MKTKRQNKIKEIISTMDITTQGELAAALKDAGFESTQATVSRDIKEMNLIKIPKNGVYVYSIHSTDNPFKPETRFQRVFAESVIDIVPCDNIIVIHTIPGNANSVCSLLDNAEFSEIAGTIAGDDTIFAVVREKALLEKVMKHLTDLMNY